jgi:hypothetical protein
VPLDTRKAFENRCAAVATSPPQPARDDGRRNPARGAKPTAMSCVCADLDQLQVHLRLNVRKLQVHVVAP